MSPETTIAERIRSLATQVSTMREQPVSRGWNEFWDAMDQLDKDSGPGFAIGRYLLLPSDDGREPYVIDQIEEQRVHVIYFGIDDGPTAGALDDDGWCLRSIAEKEIVRRDSEANKEQPRLYTERKMKCPIECE
jgi:hypothetical protein